ncbi:hypothetical protein E4K10_22995 [Streptomyces sp. T1317-0309]|nr:hypothetical protein E4K10_22995 [Streptomyces sp. T1317-0309]
MSPSTIQLLLAALGVSGTLAAAILTQALQRRAERERRTAEDLRRWHAERFRAAKDLLYKIKETERILGSAYASLPNDEEYARLRQAGHTTFFSVRETDVPQPTDDVLVFDSAHLEMLCDSLRQVYALLEEAEHLTTELSILSEGATPHARRSCSRSPGMQPVQRKQREVANIWPGALSWH